MKVPSARRERPSARRQAFQILDRVDRAGAWAGVLLERSEAEMEDPRDAGLLHEIVLGVLRRRDALDHVLGGVSHRPLETLAPSVRTLLRMGAYGLLFLDRVPEFASVDSSVALTRTTGHASATGYVNAVLRRVAREGKALLPPVPEAGDVAALALYHSHPLWWVERVVRRQGWDGAAALLAANNQKAATVLRPNLGRTTPRDLALRLAVSGVPTEPGRFVREALRVARGVPQCTEEFRAGLAWIQDEASQLVPALFGRVLRPRVADLCAAPGGKSLQLREGLPSNGMIVACDRHPGRLRRVAQNLARLGVDRVLPVAADLTAARTPFSVRFDHILVDAPCSGTGTLRRHPEIRWRLRPEHLPHLAQRQGNLLDAAASLLLPGGTIVYSVCSLEPEEGEAVVEAFLDRHANLRVLDPSAPLSAEARTLVSADGALRSSPDRGELDGFYAVLLGGSRTGSFSV